MAQNKDVVAEYVTFMLLDSELIVETPWSIVPIDENGQVSSQGVPVKTVDKYPIAISQQVQRYVGTGNAKKLVTEKIRYISECDTPYVSEQIKLGFPADRKNRLEDILELQLIGGSITTSKRSLINYLKANAGYDKFDGVRLANQRPRYKEYIVADKKQEEFEDFALAAKIASAIAGMKDIEVAKRLVLLYHPTYSNVDQMTMVDLQLVLRNIMNNDAKGIAWLKHHMIDKAGENDYDKASVLVSKALNLGFLSFEALPDYSAFDSLKTGNWQPLTPVPSMLSPEEKVKALAVWLASAPEASATHETLKSLVEKETNVNGK